MKSDRSRPRMTVAAVWLLAAAALVQGCGRDGRLETRTFDVQHLDPEEAALIVRPYVYEDREGAPGVITTFESGLSVRETPEALDRIAEVLERYDRPRPGVRLYFQIIEADGFEDPDPRIDEVREALDGLFRFAGYRLAGEASLAMTPGRGATQEVATSERTFELRVHELQVRQSNDGSAVTLSVLLSGGVMGNAIGTTLTVPVGETVVLGSSSRAESGPTTILTVRPELVTSS